MVKNSREGNRERAARRREFLAERGIKQIMLLAPEQAHPLLKQAVGFMTQPTDPMEPRAALRRAGGANDSDDASVELEIARDRIAEVERDASMRRAEIEALAEARERALQAELDAARAVEAEGRAKIDVATVEAKEAARAAQEAQERTIEALRRAEQAETTIRQAKTMPGIKGRLVRWLAGDVLPD